jgi:hypothetical protein
MKSYAPLVTLAAVVALGAGFLVANTMSQRDATDTSTAALVDPTAGDTAPSTVVDLGRLAPQAAPEAAPKAGSDAAAAPAVAEKAYAGWTSGRELSVAIAVKDGRAVGYVCDGAATEAWLEGVLSGDQLSLTSKDGATTITGTANEASSAGTVTAGGQEWSFEAEGVAAPAGLYEGRADVRGVATRVGWVVTGDGEVTGVASAAGERRPAPVLDPARPGAVVLDGVPVEVTALDGGSAVIRR